MVREKWVIIDRKFKANKTKYILQCAMTFAAVACILVVMHTLFGAAVLAAFGATCFIVFAMPHKHRSNNRAVLGGHVVGIAAGLAMRGVLYLINPAFEPLWLAGIFGALAIALAIFVMAVTNTEHPPAAGIALGIALEGYTWLGLAVLVIAVLILILIKHVLRRWMIDLV